MNEVESKFKGTSLVTSELVVDLGVGRWDDKIVYQVGDKDSFMYVSTLALIIRAGERRSLGSIGKVAIKEHYQSCGRGGRPSGGTSRKMSFFGGRFPHAG